MGADLREAARSEGVVVSHPGRGLVRLTGPQRAWFLQNTVTADVEAVPDGRWVESCFLEPKGHVVAHFRIGVLGDEIWLDVDPPAAGLVDWLVRYRFRTKVEIEERSAGSVVVLGPRAAALGEPGQVRTASGAVVFADVLGDLPMAVVHGEERPAEAAGLPEADDSLYEALRIEAGVPRFGVDYGPKDLPQEAGLTRLLPVDKGCYVGQEVVARLHFRGHVNKVLRTLRLTGAEAPVGRRLLANGEPVGVVTSAAGHAGIGMVRVEPEAGTVLEIEGGGQALLGPVPGGTKVKEV